MQTDDGLLPHTELPSFPWRAVSYQTILTVSTISRAFLFGLNKTEVHGLPEFLDLLKTRWDYRTRRRGLLTVSNHISVIDDPLMWGVLPISFTALYGYMNHRWTLGSHDICFNGAFRSLFFTLGQTLPTHRYAHSRFGGIFQPTMTEAVRVLSRIDVKKRTWRPYEAHEKSWSRLGSCYDPFSDIFPPPIYPSQPDDSRNYLAPSRYACNSYGWVHIFPEGFIHQHPGKVMRYFKWGVSRLILEPVECPVIVPIFIEGTDKIMHESRQFPRFVPRIGKEVTITFGKEVDTETVFGDLRKRWKELLQKEFRASKGREWNEDDLGILPESLHTHPEAVELRKECARRIREEVLKVRRSRGLDDEDPKYSRVETWMKEGSKREGEMKDGSWVKET